MIKACKTKHFKEYLTIAGYEKSSGQPSAEKWINKAGKFVIFNTIDDEIPPYNIEKMIAHIGDTPEKFNKIIAVII